MAPTKNRNKGKKQSTQRQTGSTVDLGAAMDTMLNEKLDKILGKRLSSELNDSDSECEDTPPPSKQLRHTRANGFCIKSIEHPSPQLF